MKQTIYIIPGFGSSCREKSYISLARKLKPRFNIKKVNPDWRKPLSGQIFRISENDIVIGFSFGAVLAYLISKKFKPFKTILASLSPLKDFTYKELFTDNLKYMSSTKAAAVAKDLKKIHIDLTKVRAITISGEKENMSTDFIVLKTGHSLTPKYVNSIVKLV